jgi:beta-barrel assembly-enhancing protease
MSKIHYTFLFLLLLGGTLVIYILYQKKSQPPMGISFSPVFQLLGKPVKSADKAITRLLPINQMDEKEYGDILAEEYLSQANKTDSNYIYINQLIKEVSGFSKKKFTYRAFIISTPIENAFALPGGIICVTKGLLDSMKSEAEIVSILGHEMGHIERGHCFDAIKFELTFKKIKSATIGEFADFVLNTLIHHTFSKTEENEADEYGYDLLLLTPYDPMECSGAFKQLQKEYGTDQPKSDIISDYFNTHPPLPLRIEKSEQNAIQWWKEHKGEKRYTGVKNLRNRITMVQKEYTEEWKTFGDDN